MRKKCTGLLTAFFIPGMGNMNQGFQTEIHLWANGKDDPESSNNLVEILCVFSQTLEYPSSLYMSNSLHVNLKNLKFMLGGKT